MRKNISLDELNAVVGVFNLLKNIELLEQKDFMVTWEKKPVMTINELGEFEFTNPEEVYACKIEFWGDYSFGPSTIVRFIVGEKY